MTEGGKRDFFEDGEVFTSNAPRVFTGEYLQQIRFPIGGIGTGTVSLGGRGELRDWEILNRPNRDSWLPFCLFFIRATPKNERPVMRVLEREWLPPYDGTRGAPEENAPGLPRFQEAIFSAEYPSAWLDLQDDDVPIRVRLHAFNPLVPLDVETSAIPAACFIWQVTNTSAGPAEMDLYGSLYNACGHQGEKEINRGYHSGAGGNVNEFVQTPSASVLLCRQEGKSTDDPEYGTMALASPWEQISHQIRLGEMYDRWVTFQELWCRLEDGGSLNKDYEPQPSPKGRTQIGVLGARAHLQPGESVEIPMIISWHFPNRTDRWGRPADGPPTGNHYATRFEDACDVASQVAGSFDELQDKTRLFRQALYGSTMPGYVLEAIGANLTALRSNTCFMDREGRFFGYEGSRPGEGCCSGTCTHVWNYAQSVAWLFPSLERSARHTEFALNTDSSGRMPFRTPLPPGVEDDDAIPVAADGQMGAVIRAYREWLVSGDEAFLQVIWPGVRRALEYAWDRWDTDGDGLMEQDQHNTTDREFYGPNPYCSILYITALEAGTQLARAMGKDEAAAEYERVAASGRKKLEQLWFEEYYRQDPDGFTDQPHQLGDACASDQLMGQWFADFLGLPAVAPAERVIPALTAIFEHNWQTDLHNHPNVRRAFALADEQALVYCTWPHGGRPEKGIFRSSEVWTGMEYMVASHLIRRGMIKEGLSIVLGIRRRHDGKRRNPWNEVECGDHYVRAMASWAVLHALSGFRYSAPEKAMEFAPVLDEDPFRSFWSIGEAWGTYEQEIGGDAKNATLTVLHGELRLKRLVSGFADVDADSVGVTLGGEQIPAAIECPTSGEVEIAFDTAISITADEALVIESRV